MRNYVLLLEELLYEELGYEELCEELLRAMSYEQEIELLEYIARMHDIDYEDIKGEN